MAETTTPRTQGSADILQRRHWNGYNVACVCFSSLGTLAYGYSGSIIGSTLGQPSFLDYMGLSTASNATQLLGAIGALFFGGGVFGCLIGSFLSDRYGRKSALATGATLLIISAALLTGSVNVGMFIAVRFLNGMGAYMLLACVPLYITELVPPHSRGWLVDQVAVWNTFGYMSASWVGYGFFFYKGNGNEWRPPLSFQIIPAAILLSGLKCLPESPRWLISKGRNDEAWKILNRLHTLPTDADDLFAKAEFLQIKTQFELDSQFQSSYYSLFTYPPYRKRLITATLWIFFTQCSGALIIVNYSPTVYGLLGYGPQLQILYSAGWLTLNFGANFISQFTIDLLPRNRYMAVGLSGCLVCLILEASLIAEFLHVEPPNYAALKAATFAVFFFAVCYGIFCDGAMFILPGEIYPNHLRSKGVNLALATHAASNILWTTPAATAFKNIGWKYYLPLICLTAVGIVSILAFFPDTRGVPLEEIARLFGDDEMVAVYQRDLSLEPNILDKKLMNVESVEIIKDSKKSDSKV